MELWSIVKSFCSSESQCHPRHISCHILTDTCRAELKKSLWWRRPCWGRLGCGWWKLGLKGGGDSARRSIHSQCPTTNRLSTATWPSNILTSFWMKISFETAKFAHHEAFCMPCKLPAMSFQAAPRINCCYVITSSSHIPSAHYAGCAQKMVLEDAEEIIPPTNLLGPSAHNVFENRCWACIS